jgi:hypothetical protein
MDIELLLAHPKQGGSSSSSSSAKDYRGRPLIIHHFQLQKSAERYGSGCFSELDVLADVACGRTLSDASGDTADSFGSGSGSGGGNGGSNKTEDESDFEDGKVKAKRKRASAYQLEMLRKIFQKTPFPSSESRKRLAKELGMTPRSVQIWFQNQRQLARNLLPNKGNGVDNG